MTDPRDTQRETVTRSAYTYSVDYSASGHKDVMAYRCPGCEVPIDGEQNQPESGLRSHLEASAECRETLLSRLEALA